MMRIQMRLSRSISQKPCAARRAAPAASRAVDDRFLLGAQPLRLGGPVGQQPQARATPSSTDGSPSSSNIHCQPLQRQCRRRPAASPRSAPPITLASGTAARNSAMNRARVACGKPVGHVEDHAGIKPGLRRAQQKAQHIES